MEENKNIVLVINSILNKNLFYSNKDSLVQKSLNQFHDLFNDSYTDKLFAFLNEQKENNLLLNEKDIVKLIEILNIDDGDFLKDLNLTQEEILNEFKEIKPLEHVLPFKLVSSLMIDKKFFKNIDIDNHSEVRKELLPITKLINEMSNNGLLINDINFEFSYTENKSSGFCNKNKIFVQCNKLDSSSLKHEYFHTMDINLAKILNVKTTEEKVTFSEFNVPNLELKEFNNFIKEMDKSKSSQKETKENLNLYFQKHLPNLNKDLYKVKEEDIFLELNSLAGDIYTDGKGNNKFDNRDNLVKELKEQIEYGLGHGNKPERTIYAIISDIKDLSTSYDYFSKIPEKLARIYQSQYHHTDDNRIFPLGTEKKLSNELNKIISSEFRNVFEINNNISIHQINKNIFKLREIARDNVNKLQMP